MAAADIEEKPDTRSFMDRVEDSLRKAQQKKAFKDSDIRIGGAKKEMAAIRKLTRVGIGGKTISGIDLDALSAQEKEYGEVTMIKFVKKDQVFPKFDVRAQMEDGVSSGAAFLKMKLRESFPNEPKIKTEILRRVYVGFANLLYDSFLKAKKVAEVKEVQEKIASEIKMNFTKFVLGDVYPDATKALLEMIEDESNPPKTDFKDFEEAYDYLNAYAQVAFSKYRALREITLDRLNKDFGLVPYKIANDLTDSSDESIRGFADRWCNRIENYRGKETQLYHFIKHYFDLNAKMVILGGDINNYGYATNPTNHLFTIALRKIPLVDKHNRPLRDRVEPYELVASLFTTGFANFIMQLGSYYSGAQKENYESALSYEAVSPEQSEQQIAKFKAANEDNIRHEQDMLTAIMKAKTVDEVDELYKANKIHSYGFYMTFRSPSGRSKTDHAFWDKLTDNTDKWAWVSKYIQSGEKCIKEWNERLTKFIETHQPHPDDWAWAADILGNKPTDPVTGLPVDAPKRKAHSNTPLDYIERFGGLRIDKSKLNDQEDIRRYMQDTFGFKEFELGASLKDEEAKEIIYHFLGAISDFGDILNFDFAELNRRMSLSMGFATRGSGSANAHYESLGRIINLAKSRGDGSVAHELGHYLDNVIPALDHISTYNYAQFATYEKENKGYQPGNIQNPAVKMAMLEIMAFILYGKKKIQRFDIRGEQMEPGFDTGQGSYLDYVAKAENAGDRRLRTPVFFKELDELPEIYAARSGRYVYYENCSRSDLLVYDIAVREAGLKEYTFKLRSKMSLYYTNSSRAGGDYWVRPTELFARAFEVYVADKLKAAGRANNFLCHGEYSDEADQYEPNYPYPQFEERKYLFGLFDNLFVQLKQAYNLGDFVPFTTETNEHTREELALSGKELVKLRQNYEKRLRVLLSILTTDVKTIKLDNGYIVSYRPDEKYAPKHYPGQVFTLKKITPKTITLTDASGKELLLSDDAFIADYENAGQIFAAGGNFIAALKAEPDNEFYRRFVAAYEPYRDYVEGAQAHAWENRKSRHAALGEHEEYTLGRATAEAALTEFFNLPNWREGLAKIGKLADEINSVETFAIVKEELLLTLAEKMLPLFDELKTPRGDEAMNEISVLQLAIDVVNANDSDEKNQFKSWDKNSQALAKKILIERGEKFNTNKKENDLEISQLAERVQKVIGSIFDDLEIKNFNVEEFEELGEEYEKSRYFGFNRVIIDGYGRASYHANEIERFRFGDKNGNIEMTICESPNGLYFYGRNMNYGTGGGGYGCWLREEKACKTIQEAYNGFFTEAYLLAQSWKPADEKRIVKQMKDKLNISEEVVKTAQELWKTHVAREDEEKRLEKEKEDAAIAEIGEYIQPGDKILIYEPKSQYSSPAFENNTGPLVEFTVVGFEDTLKVYDFAQENAPGLGDYVVGVKCTRPYTTEELLPENSWQIGEDENAKEETFYLAVIDGKVWQCRTEYSSLDNIEPIVKDAPVKIIKADKGSETKPCHQKNRYAWQAYSVARVNYESLQEGKFPNGQKLTEKDKEECRKLVLEANEVLRENGCESEVFSLPDTQSATLISGKTMDEWKKEPTFPYCLPSYDNAGIVSPIGTAGFWHNNKPYLYTGSMSETRNGKPYSECYVYNVEERKKITIPNCRDDKALLVGNVIDGVKYTKYQGWPQSYIDTLKPYRFITKDEGCRHGENYKLTLRLVLKYNDDWGLFLTPKDNFSNIYLGYLEPIEPKPSTHGLGGFPTRHSSIVMRGERFYNTDKLVFRLGYGNGFIEIETEDKLHIIQTSSEVPMDEIEQKLEKLGFTKQKRGSLEMWWPLIIIVPLLLSIPYFIRNQEKHEDEEYND